MKKKQKRTKHPESLKVFVVSLGCPKNLVDTEVVVGGLLQNAFVLVFDPAEADLYMLSTCAFIPSAREETEEEIAMAAAWKNEAPKKRRVIVCGCIVQWDENGSFRKCYPEVDLWAGIDSAEKLGKLAFDLFEKAPEGKIIRKATPEYMYDHKTPRLQLTLPHIAYLKIADGCDNRCAYCSIPNIRGNMRSRSIASVVTEAKNLIAGGVKEILLIAQDITTFGADNDIPEENMAELLRQLDALEGDYYLRMLYTHPAHFNDEIIEVMGQCRHLLPYVDVPLQHINDKILKNMGRRVTSTEIQSLLKKLRKAIPDIAIRTTFITGLPGEDKEAYNELVDFIKIQRFERLGVFAFSPEPGTPAATMPNTPELEVAEKRSAEIMKIQAKIALETNTALIGQEIKVIVDWNGNGSSVGRSLYDAPEIDNTVIIQNVDNLQPGAIITGKVVAANEYELEVCVK
jgi:ribosomal protein S12 methylthiotransferase